MESNQSKFNQNNPWWKPAMFFYAKVTSWIILPVLIALVLSRYIVENNQIMFFVLMVVSFCITCFGIYREIKIYQKEVNKENGNK